MPERVYNSSWPNSSINKRNFSWGRIRQNSDSYNSSIPRVMTRNHCRRYVWSIQHRKLSQTISLYRPSIPFIGNTVLHQAAFIRWIDCGGKWSTYDVGLDCSWKYFPNKSFQPHSATKYINIDFSSIPLPGFMNRWDIPILYSCAFETFTSQ